MPRKAPVPASRVNTVAAARACGATGMRIECQSLWPSARSTATGAVRLAALPSAMLLPPHQNLRSPAHAALAATNACAALATAAATPPACSGPSPSLAMESATQA